MSSSTPATSDNFVLTRVVWRYTVPLKGPDESRRALRSSPRFVGQDPNDDEIVPLILPPGLSGPGYDERASVLRAMIKRQLRRVKFCADLRGLAKSHERSPPWTR